MSTAERCDRGHLLSATGTCDVCTHVAVRKQSAASTDATPVVVRYPATDSGNAELFGRLNKDLVRFDHRRKRWLLWAEHFWRSDRKLQIMRLATDAARIRFEQAATIENLRDREIEAKWAIQSENKYRIEATLDLARAEKSIADEGNNWDENGWLLGVANGVLDLKTGKTRPGKQSDRMTMQSAVHFDADVLAPRWQTFIGEIFAGDADLIDYIWRAAGYSLTGETGEQCHFLCWGGGSNGKTTFLRVLREILGEYGDNTPFSTLEMSSRNTIPNDLAALHGKRLVTASELNEAVRLNEARLKMLAGEDPVTARFLHGEFFTFVPVSKFWLSVNHKPIVNDDSTGFWRKIRLIPFTETFEGRADKDLKECLRREYPGILAWMVRGCLEWQARGLASPTAVLTATGAYRAESDPVAVFLQERCVANVSCLIRAGEFYRAYLDWADDAGLNPRERLSNTKFGRIMTDRFEKKEQASGNVYLGIGLRAQMEGRAFDYPPETGFVPSDELREKTRSLHPQPSNHPEDVDDYSRGEAPVRDDAPQCIKCRIPMSAVRVRNICGRCQRP